jgi:general nucleoside transport system permease protein
VSQKPIFEHRFKPNDSFFVYGGTVLLSVFLALFLGAFLFLPFAVDPIKAYLLILQNSFGNLQGIANTLVKTTPLIFVGLATIVAWRSGYFYMGFEGSILTGALMSAWIALMLRPGQPLELVPWPIYFPLIFLLGFLAAGLWSFIPALLKVKFGSNEVIVSLMMNYVAALLSNFILSGPLRAPGDIPQSMRMPDAALLPFIIPNTRAHVGILIALISAFIVWIIIMKTPLGYELIICGLNKRAAKYSGIDTNRRILFASILAGGLAGLAGTIDLLGVQFRLMDGFTHDMGFIGIVTAILGKLHPLGLIPASILYAGMGVGADAMQRQVNVPRSLVFSIQSLIVLLILAGDILRYYRINLPWLHRDISDKKTKPWFGR